MVLFAVTLMIAGWPTRPDRDWQIGTVVRGSIRDTGDGFTFTLRREVGGTCMDRLVEVHVDEPRSSTICDEVDVAVEGERESHGAFAAARAHGFNNGRYDGCWEHRCDRDAYDRCRRRTRLGDPYP